MANTFSLILVVVTLVTGIIWVLDKFLWAPKRRAKIEQVKRNSTVKLDQETLNSVAKTPIWIENTAPLFPVIAAVLILRSFLFEPFQIPSGSMMPTLLVGDFILVEKYAYGLHDPVTHSTIIETGEPQRGDIVVFKYPEDPSIDFIKRVVGLPGDTVIYKDKQLYIKAKGSDKTQHIELSAAQQTPFSQDIPIDSRGNFKRIGLVEYQETLGDVTHSLLQNPMLIDNPVHYRPRSGSTEWVVPDNEYFVMGDNRDNSKDSRFWGFVPKGNLVGKAIGIWVSFEFERSADDLLPTWVPTNIRFNRIGGIQ